MDSIPLEENKALLQGRWRYLRERRETAAHSDLGMDFEAACVLRDLEPIQVELAADTDVPLFRLAVPDHVLEKLLQRDQAPLHHLAGEADRVIQAENQLFLLNRRHEAALSELNAQSTYALSSRAIRALLAAGFSDIQRASASGCVLAAYAAKPRYLFHAGRHMGLNRTQRNCYATCCVTRRTA